MKHQFIISTGKTMLLIFILLAPVYGQSQNGAMGLFEGNTDVGNIKIPGIVSFNQETGEYKIGGSGANMWFANDDFHFVWKRLEGDFLLRTRAKFLGEGTNAHRKVGWMIRHSLEPNTPYADAVVHGDGLTSLQFRRTVDGLTEEVTAEMTAPEVIQLERKGNTISMSVAKSGMPMKQTGSIELNLGNEVYVGLVMCSHDKDVFEEAIYSNVRIIKPAKDDFVPYEDYLGSRLEILDIETGLRKVIYTSKDAMEAPNWTMDGKALIYNSKGLLYRFDLQKNKPEVINTGFANQNNNDHVLSADGKQIATSHHMGAFADGTNSQIFVLPITGGTPTQVTQQSPSYLHGWSPDGKFLIYTAERNGEFDIYKIPTQGGNEIKLTSAKGLDDGSEYGPKGKYIYFNSNRTGTMQIWRMTANGKKQEQMTFDDYQDWFPHPSPDGKSMVILSFPSSVDSGDHPHYKQVMLRIMPLAGGDPKVITYIYGGQGTFNVPSWSPDSKKVAFVSYSSD